MANFHKLINSASGPLCTVKIITTVIAAISAAVIAAQSKLRYGEVGEMFSNVASTYAMLVGEAYFAITDCNILGQKKELGKSFENLLQFLKISKTLEKNAKDGCPFLPGKIEKSVNLGRRIFSKLGRD